MELFSIRIQRTFQLVSTPSKLILMLCTIPLCVTCGKLTNRLTRKVKQKKRL